MERLLGWLERAYDRFDCSAAHTVLVEVVAGFANNGPAADLLWQAAGPMTGKPSMATVAYFPRRPEPAED